VVPVGFGHAFMTLEPGTEICYKVDDYYSPDCDGAIRWDCPDIAIEWQLSGPAVLSEKDAALPTLCGFESPFAYDGMPMHLARIE
jgi:dTDP-4-dehydrorhamnose 3,5-epimerase